MLCEFLFFFSSRRRHTRWNCDWSSDVCSSDRRPAQADTRAASSTEVTLTSTLSAAAAPGLAARPAARYVVQPGDPLSGIAARFAVRGGWPALYAANRKAIGPDPNLIHSGTVLVLPG